MQEPLVRTEQWAVIDSKNEVRVLLSEEKKAQRLCDRFHRLGMDSGPFRVAFVYVVEMVGDPEPTPDPTPAPLKKRGR